jgi:RNA polymerase sigma factor (sigma-70 family)
MHNCVFGNLRRYLEHSLSQTSYAYAIQRYGHATEDIVHQTLETLYTMIARCKHAGPDDPASFLQWSQTILIRQAQAFLIKCQRNENVSLETLPEPLTERFVDTNNSDPLEYVLLRELQQTLGSAILSLRNPRYRQVLIYTYVAGVDDGELARRLQVQVQHVYLWRHRALKALRNKPEVMQTLRALLE